MIMCVPQVSFHIFSIEQLIALYNVLVGHCLASGLWNIIDKSKKTKNRNIKEQTTHQN